MTDPKNHVLPERPVGDHRNIFPGLDDRDYACILLPDLDYDAQLNAIRDLLRRQTEAASSLSNEIDEIAAHARRLSGSRNAQAVDEWIERMYARVYQDAAHSMAAVGMLAPLVESIFHKAFLNIGEHYATASVNLPSHPRWQQAREDEWDCHFVWNKGWRSKNLVHGIFQLADAVGLAPLLPKDLRQILKALFEYRNKMFHHGFEWPVDERRKFSECKRLWPGDWFIASESGGNPWVFYMSDTFISKCVVVTQQSIKSIGAFARGLLDGAAQQINPGDPKSLRD